MKTKKTRKQINSRTKGHNAERKYAQLFRELGFQNCVTSRYGSRQYDNLGVDLINLPINIQIKVGKQKNLNTKETIQQIKNNLQPINDNKPLALLRKYDITKGQKKLDSDELVTLTLKDFLEILKKAYL